MTVDVDAFARPFENSQRPEVPRLLWEMIRKRAFVFDFRPGLDDSLDKILAMGWEEVEDEMVLPLLEKLGLSTSEIDFTGFDFTSITTPREVIAFILKIADAQGGQGKRRFVDMA